MSKHKNLKHKNIWAMTLLASAVMLGACQPKHNDAPPEPDKAAAEAAPDLSHKLIGDSEELQLAMPDCSGNSCPEISVERLNSNQPFIDAFIDQQVLRQLNEIVPAETEASEAEAAGSASAASEAQGALAQAQTPKLKLEKQTAPYVQAFLNLDKELKALSSAQRISVMIKPKILNADLPLAVVVLNSSSYLGGAHGASAQQYFSFDLKSKQLVKLDELIAPKQKAKLNQLAHQAFKTWVSEAKLADSVEEYEQAWKYKLSENYYLGKDGLILQYAEYEIGPYVVGLPRLTIPYSQLDGVLKAQYLPVKAEAAASEAAAQ